MISREHNSAYVSTAVAQIVFDFDTTAPTTTDELPDFFDVFGFDAGFG